MKHLNRTVGAVLLVVSVLSLCVMQSAEAIVATMSANPVIHQWLGVSYSKINTSTLANLVSLDSNAQEIVWVKRVLMGSDSENVFSDNMMGPPGSGKAFIVNNDLKKVDGDTIIVPTVAPLGGPGSQGEGDRTGNEEKIRISSFPVKIGRQWYGVGITDVAKEQTVIGSKWDGLVNVLLRKRLGKKKSEDMMKVLIASASASNTVRPNFKSTREGLRTADTIGTTTITKSGLVLSGLGGKAVKLRKSRTGADIESFLFFGNQYALATLRSESAYLTAITQAGVRGDDNPLFKGDFTMWDGHGIYRWMIRDHEAYGAVGSSILPRAFLGEAIVADDNAPTIKGGGDGTGANLVPAPLYFEFFSNALYTFTNGNTVAADTTTVRYVAIQNLTGSDAGKIGFYSYKVNDGNKLTVFKRLRSAATGASLTTVGNVIWNTAPWLTAGNGTNFAGLTDAHPVGSLIVETNSYGVPFCGSFMLGEMAGIAGHGSLNGRNAMGARTQEDRNHNMDHGIGIETVYGCAATKRTDQKTPNYVYVESAYSIDGFPTVT